MSNGRESKMQPEVCTAFLGPRSYSDTLDEVCVVVGNWMGQIITQQEVDSK